MLETDKRKLNGGKSTKSKKAFDRRKRISISDNKSFNDFFNRMKEDMMVFYESAYKGFLDENVRHGDYYVYSHSDSKGVVYIGKGKGDRLFNWSSRICPEHSEALRLNCLNVEIIANNLKNETALLIESSLIEKINPKYNKK